MNFRIDRVYLSTLLQIAVPIAIQNGINALLSMTDSLMVGQLGSTSVAAVALANQVAFLLTFFMYGVTSGAVAFTAQFWGKKDLPSIRKVLGICLALCVLVAAVFTLIAEFFPSRALGLYSEDRAVIELGAGYLRIVGASYLLSAVSFSFSAVLKGMGRVRIPMLVSIIALSLKAVFSYTLIFGAFGIPAQGVIGGAIGTLAARIVEFILMIAIVYLRRTPVAAKIPELLTFNRKFVGAYLKVALPVVLNEMLWSLGVSLYSAIYAHISTDALAAVNIATSIESLAFVLLVANSDAGGILTGTQIGAGDEEKAYFFARRSILLATGIGLCEGILILAISGFFPDLYQVSQQVRGDARAILTIMGLIFWVRGSNLTLIVGVMRSGGDTRYSAVIDIATVWLVGIPLALAGAYWFHAPIWAVYLLVMGDEVAKYLLGLRRFFTRRWIHNLAHIGA